MQLSLAVQLFQISLQVVNLCMLRRFVSTLIFIDLLLFSDESAHPQRVVVVKDKTLIFWKLAPVLFQHIRTFFVLSQLKKVPSEKKDRLEFRFWSSDVNVILFVFVSVAVDETADKERLFYVAFSGDSQKELADPDYSNYYHLAE